MKVVIIDDEPLISDKLKRIMETGLRGMHTVCAFTDAQMALDYIEQEKPGVILTDIRMPGITGRIRYTHFIRISPNTAP